MNIMVFIGTQKIVGKISTITTTSGKCAKKLEYNSLPSGKMSGETSKIL